MKIIDLIPEKELKEVVLSEYERRLVLYKLIDEKFKKKYGTNYAEFERKNVVKEKGFSWEVERDAMEWEHAVESINPILEKINKVKKADDKS